MGSTPPEWPVHRPRPKPRTLWSDLGGLWQRYRGLPFLPKLIIGLLVIILVVAVASIPFRSSPETTVTVRTTTTAPAPSTTTTTTKPLPPGEDKDVKAVLDGDSFETVDGIKVRLLGVDAPDIETGACFSSEATTRLQNLIGPPRSVRLVYDTSRTDRLGRTLAWVYRAPDGLFINEAMAQDGFVTELKVEPNVLYASEIAAAVTEAREARRAMWATCQSTSTTATTRPAATTTTARATTTTPATTTTTAAATTTTSSTVPATTTTLPVVVEGSPCQLIGTVAQFADGRRAACRATLLGNQWQAVT